MKTIEEKAKAYDEAIKKAAALYKASEPMSSCNVIIENLFPELKNSEDEKIESEDEKIRHYLMNFVKINDGVNLPPDYAKKALAWLEKQKDCIKLSDSAYTSNRDVIEFADKYSRTVWEKLMDKFKKNENYSIGCNDVSDIVLNAIINTYNWLERQGEQKASCTTIVETGDGGINALVTLPIEMKTAEESLGIDSDTYNKIVDECIFGEQKPKENKGNIGGISPNWSEEDEQHVNSLLKRLDSLCRIKFERTRFAISEDRDWLKSLRPQNQWKPSDEQIKVCKEVYADILSAKGFDLGTVVSELNRLEEGLKKKGE